MLNNKQRLFAFEYCKDLNATQAATRAGYSELTAGQIGHELLKNLEISALIAEHLENVAAASEITIEGILKRWWEIANANPNDLIQTRRVNCRFCNGHNHEYQWTVQEFMRAVELATDKRTPIPTGVGGLDFDLNAPPHPDCQECAGEGEEVVHLADSRKLKGGAKLLYGGVQKTKEGVKVTMRDQDAALQNLARYMGMTTERKIITGINGGPVALAHLKADDLTDDQLSALIGLEDDATDQE